MRRACISLQLDPTTGPVVLKNMSHQASYLPREPGWHVPLQFLPLNISSSTSQMQTSELPALNSFSKQYVSFIFQQVQEVKAIFLWKPEEQCLIFCMLSLPRRPWKSKSSFGFLSCQLWIVVRVTWDAVWQSAKCCMEECYLKKYDLAVINRQFYPLLLEELTSEEYPIGK